MSAGSAVAATPPRQRLTLVLLGVGAALWAALAVAVPAQGNAQTAADEPHYLLSAISLGEDGSLDVSDELRADRQHAFHEAELPRQADAGSDGEQIAPHDPGLPAVLALPVRLGGWVGAKISLAALFGLLAVTMAWTAIHRFAVPHPVAVLAVATFLGAAPLAVYGTQVYPEMLGALAVTVAISALAGSLDRKAFIAVCCATVALPWLSVKYAPTAAALVALALWQLVRSGRGRTAVVVVAVLAAAGVLFAVAHTVWYGGLTPYAAGYHFRTGELSVIGTDPNYAGRAQRITGLLFDRDFGLVVWQPAFLLAVPALAAAVRSRPRGWEALAVPVAAGWFTATFVALTMHGWWFPGRQVVHVLPCAVLAVAWWSGRETRVRPWLWVALAYGASVYLWLVWEGLAGDVTMVVDFARISHPLRSGLRLALPDYRHLGATGSVLHVAGIALVVLLARAGWGWRAREDASEPAESRSFRSQQLQEMSA